MAVRADRIEARVAPEKAERIRRAAQAANQSVSAFVVDAASEKAEKLLLENRETVVPAEFFDALLAALDEPAVALPALAKARSRTRRTVQPR
jgi:uncharacterized protein (DUF1778 family)